MTPRVTPSQERKALAAQPTERTVGGIPVTRAESFLIGSHRLTDGSTIRVLPSAPRRRDGFVGTVRSAWVDDTGALVEVSVVGRVSPKRPDMIRTYKPSRVQWMRQPKESK